MLLITINHLYNYITNNTNHHGDHSTALDVFGTGDHTVVHY